MAQQKNTASKKGSNTSAKKKPPAKQDKAKVNYGSKELPKDTPIDKEALKSGRLELTAIIILILSLIFFVFSIFKGGDNSVFRWLHDLHIGIWGFTAYIVPFVMVAFSFLLSKYKSDRPYKILISAIVLLWMIAGFWFVVRYDGEILFKEFIKSEFGAASVNAGFFGAFFGGLLLKLTGSPAASSAILIVIILGSVLLITGTTVARLGNALGKGARNVSKKTNESVQKLSENFNEKMVVRRARDTSYVEMDYKLDLPEVNPKNSKNSLGKQHKSEKDDGFDNLFASIPETPIIPQPEPEAEVELSVAKEPEASSEQTDFDNLFARLERTLENKLPESEIDSRAGDSEDDFEDFNNKEEAEEEMGVDEEIVEELEEAIDVPPPPSYKLPPIECLNLAGEDRLTAGMDELRANADKLISALKSFNVEASILNIVPGPSVTRYELSPASGVKISKFMNLSDDLALHLAAPAGVRIEAPIPNKAAIGIEIPNRKRAAVLMRSLIEDEEYKNAKSKLTVALGKDISGRHVYADLAKMPHLLVAGTTGSGKSVCLNTMLISLLYNATPSEVKLLLIDPKTVEFSMYNGIPHLLVPVVNDARKAAGALGWAVTEMVNRYKVLNDNNVRDIAAYNSLCEGNPDIERMPQIVIVIDELSDLMSVAPNEVEDSITRLAQMARAAGMHLVVATQRPSVDVITGLIKANIPSRIALSVSSQTDSRTIIDSGGAEKLLGNGDMLFYPIGMHKPQRVQGCYISTEEIERIITFIKTQEICEYDETIQEEIDRQAVPEKKKGDAGVDAISSAADDLFMKAADFVISNPKYCSISSLQRKLGLGFSKAGKLMDELEEQGIVGPSEGSKPRKVLLTKAQWLERNALSGGEE